jgi:hypothetical protein
VRPDTMISLGSAVGQKGAGLIECPVGGGTVPAREGKLLGLGGGTNAHVALGESLTICRPLNLPAERLIDILSDTAGAPAAMKGRGAIIPKVLGGGAAWRNRIRPQCCEKRPSHRRAIRGLDPCATAGRGQRAGVL